MKKFFVAGIISLLFSFPIAALSKAASPASGRFFLMGDGFIRIENSKTGQEADVSFYSQDGSLNEKAWSEIDKVFGFPTGEDGKHISARLISALDYFSDLTAPGQVIHLDSGYRSPRYNAKLRNAGGNVAKTSTHMDGLALDFHIDGVDGKKLWQIIKDGNCCGVGYYGGKDIHLDMGRPRFWEAATSKVRTGSSDDNQKVYLSTDYDRYKAGETVHLLLSSISDFSFGVERTVLLVDDKSDPIASSRIKTEGTHGCIKIGSRKRAHSLFFNLPQNLPSGRYRVKMTFCQKPSIQMPTNILSNELEMKKKDTFFTKSGH